jgi:hypothetical protein
MTPHPRPVPRDGRDDPREGSINHNDEQTKRLDGYIPLRCVLRVCDLCHRVLPANEVRKDLRLGRILCNDGEACLTERVKNRATRAA